MIGSPESFIPVSAGNVEGGGRGVCECVVWTVREADAGRQTVITLRFAHFTLMV